MGAEPTLIPTPPPMSPPPGKIAFVTTQEDSTNRDIYWMDTDGSNQMNLTQHPADDYDPDWSPDGRQIVFSSRRYGGQSQLMIMDIETREAYRLKGPIGPETNVDLLSTDIYSEWSPDGQWIAYTSGTINGNSDIYKIRIDGTDETQLTNFRAPDIQPTWSPDGSQIAFVSWYRGDPMETFLHPYEKNIFIMNADGSNIRRFTDDRDIENEFPRWSQDGQWIFYNVLEGPGRFTEMSVREHLVTHERQLIRQTDYLGITSDQSPDGKWLVFDEWQFSGPGTMICFIQITGQNYQCLTPPVVEIQAIYARWQPMAVPDR